MLGAVLVLIGGPSGAGKSTLARELTGSDFPGAECYDLRLMPHDLASHCIIECGTHDWVKMTRMPQWRRIEELMPSYDRVVAINLLITRRQLAAQYARRIFTEPAHKPMWRRVIKLGKWRQALRYLCTPCAADAFEKWERHDWPAKVEKRVTLVCPRAVSYASHALRSSIS